MTCGDIYTLESPGTCGDIWAFPSQLHPTPPDGGGGGGVRPGLRPFVHPRQQPTKKVAAKKKKRVYDTEEDILAVLGLL
jgi:hypothetical protein